MNQEWLIKNVLKNLDSVPDHPADGREYLSYEESQRIVDETIDDLGAHGEDTEYTYLNGHRKRLAHSLSMIPKAKGPGESCLDVGSYGYMLYWAKVHLGYDHVIGIEWHPGRDDLVIVRRMGLDEAPIEVESYNFDIAQPDWAIDGAFDTILFFEVLEHINQDPMGVMERIHHRLAPGGTLVMSVPNAISYKAFREFLVGMPPWTYWFYEPDLSHEPRHCFEYTPIIFKTLIRASGLQENAFRIIYAYSEPEQEEETLEIARSFGMHDESLGETMIINATRVSDTINLRYPDVLYSPEGYYKAIYPHLRDRLGEAIDYFRNAHQTPPIEIKPDQNTQPDPAASVPQDTQGMIEERSTESGEQIADLLRTCDSYLQSVDELQLQVSILQSENQQAAKDLAKTRDWANNLQRQNAELEAKVNELLYTCDCFLRKEGEMEIAEHSAERARSRAVEDAGEARDLAIADRDSTLQEANESRQWAENLAKENADLRAQVNELLFACDCYLQQVNDPARCVQVVRERQLRSVLRVSKSVARKTPLLRTALRPMYRSTKKFIKRRM